MVVTPLRIKFEIDEEKESIYSIEGSTSGYPYDNIIIMIRRTEKK